MKKKLFFKEGVEFDVRSGDDHEPGADPEEKGLCEPSEVPFFEVLNDFDRSDGVEPEPAKQVIGFQNIRFDESEFQFLSPRKLENVLRSIGFKFLRV